MAFKFVAILAFIAMANAEATPVQQVYHTAPAPTAYIQKPVAYTAPNVVQYAPAHDAVAYAPVHAVHAHAQPVQTKYEEEYDSHPQYKYGYSVQDEISGDSKSQVEERDGDVVRGEYSLIDADGFKRTVQYTADDVNGFNAVVHREPVEHVKTIVKAAPITYTAPATFVKEIPEQLAYHQYH